MFGMYDDRSLEARTCHTLVIFAAGATKRSSVGMLVLDILKACKNIFHGGENANQYLALTSVLVVHRLGCLPPRLFSFSLPRVPALRALCVW